MRNSTDRTIELAPYYLIYLFVPTVFLDFDISTLRTFRDEFDDEFNIRFNVEDIKDIWKQAIEILVLSETLNTDIKEAQKNVDDIFVVM